MWNQTDLFGDKLEIPENLKTVCCDSCYNAKEKVCVCQCGGAYHGLGNLNKQRFDPNDKLLNQEDDERFRSQFKDTNCLCGFDLSKEPIWYYVPHEAGWTIKQETQKAWLFLKCPKCGYEMALWKIGVKRE